MHSPYATYFVFLFQLPKLRPLCSENRKRSFLFIVCLCSNRLRSAQSAISARELDLDFVISAIRTYSPRPPFGHFTHLRARSSSGHLFPSFCCPASDQQTRVHTCIAILNLPYCARLGLRTLMQTQSVH